MRGIFDPAKRPVRVNRWWGGTESNRVGTHEFMDLAEQLGSEAYLAVNRMAGPYAGCWWALIACNVVVPQALWFRRVRASVPMLFLISLVISVGMWLERFVIVVTSLHRPFLPSSWDMYYPTVWDWGIYIGTIGFFLTLMLLFIRFLPMINVFEMRELLSRQTGHGGHAAGGISQVAEEEGE